jgi:inhibitor of cysteine peptidase
MIQIDEQYNGREVSLAVGEMLEISLAENRTTGFRWDLKSKAEPVCILVKSTFEPAMGPPGRGGTHRWQFQAVRAGTAKIELEYRRPWEQNSPPGRTLKVNVQVQKQASLPNSRPSE